MNRTFDGFKVAATVFAYLQQVKIKMSLYASGRRKNNPDAYRLGGRCKNRTYYLLVSLLSKRPQTLVKTS